MSQSREPAEKPSQGEPESDVFLTVLYAPDRESFARLLRKAPLDVGPVRARPETEGIEAHIYANQEQIRKLREDGWQLEIRENLSEVGRQRQQEVGKGDRFEGGKIPPKGLGKKTGKEE